MAAKILTVTLNPALDRMIWLSDLKKGRDHEPMRVQFLCGGKGINVSRGLQVLDIKSVACGIAGGLNGQKLLGDLIAQGIENDFVFTQGQTRCNITLLTPGAGQPTRIIEPGPVITSLDLASFRRKFRRLLSGCSSVVISGRRVPGTPEDFYFELIRAANKAHNRVYFDASGSDLAAGIEAKPFLVKPNLAEAQRLLKKQLSSRKALKTALRDIARKGARHAVISLGRDGAVGTNGDEYWLAAAVRVKPVNLVGCGDALLAGLVCALEAQSQFKDALAFGVACGTAATLVPTPGLFDRARVGEILQQIQLKPL